ncbi:hypothetical protein ABPG75_002749 [Micractinium tetrahymenae]
MPSYITAAALAIPAGTAIVAACLQLNAERAQRQAAESALAQAVQVASAGMQAQQQLLEAEPQQEASAREQALRQQLEAEHAWLQAVDQAQREAASREQALQQQLDCECSRLEQLLAAATARGLIGREQLHNALVGGDVTTMQLNLALDQTLAASHDSNGDTAFHLAAKQGSVETLQLLRDADSGSAADVLAAGNAVGRTALHVAVHWGRQQAVRWLLQAAPHLAGMRDNKGCSAMDLAGSTAAGAAIVRLLEAASPELAAAASPDGRTPLHLAASLLYA